MRDEGTMKSEGGMYNICTVRRREALGGPTPRSISRRPPLVLLVTEQARAESSTFISTTSRSSCLLFPIWLSMLRFSRNEGFGCGT